ncbi:MAG: hypothetical protein GY756_10505, partial [bacterium]|nr:hypothetical protein [bacterium]
MKLFDLVKDLREKNISIDIKDGELDIIVNDNNLSDELLNNIKNNKKQLLEYLRYEKEIRTPSDFTFK